MLFSVLRITSEVACQLCLSVSPPHLNSSCLFSMEQFIIFTGGLNLCIVEGQISIVGQIQGLPGNVDVADRRRGAPAPL